MLYQLVALVLVLMATEVAVGQPSDSSSTAAPPSSPAVSYQFSHSVALPTRTPSILIAASTNPSQPDLLYWLDSTLLHAFNLATKTAVLPSMNYTSDAERFGFRLAVAVTQLDPAAHSIFLYDSNNHALIQINDTDGRWLRVWQRQVPVSVMAIDEANDRAAVVSYSGGSAYLMMVALANDTTVASVAVTNNFGSLSYDQYSGHLFLTDTNTRQVMEYRADDDLTLVRTINVEVYMPTMVLVDPFATLILSTPNGVCLYYPPSGTGGCLSAPPLLSLDGSITLTARGDIVVLQSTASTANKTVAVFSSIIFSSSSSGAGSSSSTSSVFASSSSSSGAGVSTSSTAIPTSSSQQSSTSGSTSSGVLSSSSTTSSGVFIDSQSSDLLSAGAVVGVVLGVIGGSALTALALSLCYCRCVKHSHHATRSVGTRSLQSFELSDGSPIGSHVPYHAFHSKSLSTQEMSQLSTCSEMEPA